MVKTVAAPPKRLDPALWQAARVDWAGNPDMTFTQVAERLGVSVVTVSLRARRELWTRSDIVDLQRISYTPMQMVEVSIRTLMHAANQTRDLPTAVKAASLLLDRALGRVVAEQAQPLLPPAEAPAVADQFPEWVTARRLAYQEEIAQRDDRSR